MLKTLSTKSIMPWKSISGVNNNRKKHGNRIKLVGRDEIDNGEIRNDEIRKKRQKTSKSKNLFKSKKLSKSKKTLPLAQPLLF